MGGKPLLRSAFASFRTSTFRRRVTLALDWTDGSRRTSEGYHQSTQSPLLRSRFEEVPWATRAEGATWA